MSNVVRQPVPGQNFGPVSLDLMQRVEGGQPVGVEGVEITFNEYAPDMRNRFKFYMLFLIFWLGIPGTVSLIVVGWLFIPEWITWWEGGGIRPDQLFYSAIMVGSGVVCIVMWPVLRPPFKAPVRVYMDPANDLLEIHRNGKLVETARFSDVQGVGNEPHPKLEEAIVAAEADPKRSTNRALINRYKLAQVIYLHLGQGLTTMKTEVAAFRVSKSSNLPIQARSAIHTGWEMAMQLAGKGPIQAASAPETSAPQMQVSNPSGDLPRRRRRKKIE